MIASAANVNVAKNVNNALPKLFFTAPIKNGIEKSGFMVIHQFEFKEYQQGKQRQSKTRRATSLLSGVSDKFKIVEMTKPSCKIGLNSFVAAAWQTLHEG